MRRLFSVPLISLAFLGLYGLAEAVQDVRLVRYRVAIPGLVAPLRVVQLSDSHANWINMPPVRLRRIVAAINARHPDLVVLTGDYTSGLAVTWPDMWLSTALAPFGLISAPLGVVAVPGNHDDPYWTRIMMAKGPVTLFAGTTVDVGPLVIAGAESIATPPDPLGNLARAIARVPQGKPVIALAHEPYAFATLPARAALLVAGHTHGGQIRLPLLGARRTDGFFDSHLRGVYREHGQVMIVSSGAGTSMLPLRIGVPPEIVEIELVPAIQPAAAPAPASAAKTRLPASRR
jgi:predicted MPP superfamily phosphohydrolase